MLLAGNESDSSVSAAGSAGEVLTCGDEEGIFVLGNGTGPLPLLDPKTDVEENPLFVEILWCTLSFLPATEILLTFNEAFFIFMPAESAMDLSLLSNTFILYKSPRPRD